MNRLRIAILPALAGLVLLSGCSTGNSYQQARVSAPLEVPPEMVLPRGAAGLEVPAAALQRLSDAQAREDALARVRVERDGALHWLVLEQSPEQLWERLQHFWKDQGIDVEREDGALWLMETAWVDNRSEMPKGAITGLLSQFVPATLRDRYRVRLEPGEKAGTVELYLTHRGIREVAFEHPVTRDVTKHWEWRPSDPELEAEMLKRLFAFLRVDGELSAAQPRASVQGDLVGVELPLERAGRRLGVALDRLGLTMGERDATDGSYRVRLEDGRERRVVAAADNGRVRISVQEASGAPDRSAAARELLARLAEQLA